MKRKTCYHIALLASFSLAIGLGGWCYSVFVPLPGGLGWTGEKDIRFIEDAHPIRLINPHSVPKDQGGYVFMNWAVEEFKARVKVGMLGWTLITGALALWVMKSRREEKTITTGSC